MEISSIKLYQKFLKNKDFFFLFFYLAGGRGDEWIELYLPVPNIIIYPKNKNGVFIAYFIEGFFGTKKSQEFLKDIIQRFEKTFLKLSHIGYIERIKHPPILDNKTDFRIQLDIIYSLKEFSTILDSLNHQISRKEEQIENLKISNTINITTSRKITDDALFDYMRFIAYDFVNTNGKKALTREYLEQIGELGNEILGKSKEFSTIRAKAKAIYNWIMENYKIKNNHYKRKLSNQEYEMQKKELALKNAKMRAKRTKEKVYKAIKQLKEKNEKITSAKIMEISKVSKNSALKYIKQAREEGLI